MCVRTPEGWGLDRVDAGDKERKRQPCAPRRNRDAAKDRICLLLEHGGIEIDKQEGDILRKVQ